MSNSLYVHEVKRVVMGEIREGISDKKAFKWQDITLVLENGEFVVSVFFAKPNPPAPTTDL